MAAKTLKEATQMKTQYTKVTSNARTLLKQIPLLSHYKWADNHENKDDLQEKMTELDAAMTTFCHEFILQETKVVQDRYGNEFLANLQILIGLKPQLGAVSDAVRSIMRRSNIDK